MSKLFGVIEPKYAPWVLGALGIGVLFAVLNSKKGGSIPQPVPQGGGLPAGGGGGGFMVSAPEQIADAYTQRMQNEDVIGRQLQNDFLRRQIDQTQAAFDLQQREETERWGIFSGVLGAQADLQQAQFNTARIAEGRLSEAAKTAKMQCPVGMHLVNTPEEGLHCQQKGGGGFSFKTVFSGIGDIARNFLQGAASAAGPIGAGAAQYGAAQAGILPSAGRQGAQGGYPSYTPAFNPNASRPALQTPQGTPQGTFQVYANGGPR